MESNHVVELSDVSIDYVMKKYSIRAVSNVSLHIKRGKITALVGESGSGKTTLVSAIIRCISEPGQLSEGEIKYFGKGASEPEHIMKFDDNRLQSYRWGNVSMVFQAAQSALNPVMKVGEQFKETAFYHEVKVNTKEFDERLVKLLEYVHLDAAKVLNAYPHELSGGMKQRVMIAFSLLLDPDVIILDEPTTALDVITQDYIFGILQDINKRLNISMILLTHDIGVVAKVADYVGVMYAGRLMEYADVFSLFKKRLHPYTAGLIQATPSLSKDISGMKPIAGSVVNLLDVPSGCVFHPRCEKCTGLCSTKEPQSILLENGHIVKCHLYDTSSQ